MRRYLVAIVGEHGLPNSVRQAAEDRFADALERFLDGPEGVWAALAAREAIEAASGRSVTNDRLTNAVLTASSVAWDMRPPGVEFLVLPG